MTRDETILKVLNDSAKMIAGLAGSTDKEIAKLVDKVILLMLENDKELLQLDNLYVQISVEEGTVMSFLVDDGHGRILDLARFTLSHQERLLQKRKEKLKKMMVNLSSGKEIRSTFKNVQFSRN